MYKGITIDKIIREIEDLFNSNLTDYRIANDTGIALSMIQNYRIGSRKVENMMLKTAKKPIWICKKFKIAI